MRMQVFAAGILAMGGLVLIGMGLYFGFLRPPLLPEDLRYMHASAVQLRDTAPGLGSWLSRVFGVFGGFMAASGLLTVYVAATSFRTGERGAMSVVAISGLASIGLMVVINFLIDSDFKFGLLAVSLLWCVALAISWAGALHSRRTVPPS